MMKMIMIMKMKNENIPPIMIGPTETKRVSEIKFLGVVIDEKLSWDAHVKSLAKKLYICTGSIHRTAASTRWRNDRPC